VLTPVCGNAQWRISPTIGLGLEYDDNAALVSESAIDASTSGMNVEADAEFLYASPLSEFRITPRVRINRYDDEPALDSEDYFTDFDYKYTGQRAKFRFRGSFADESVRTAERSDVDWDVDNPSEIPTDDSGQVLSLARRVRAFGAPEWSYQLNQRTGITLSASYLDATYSDQVITTLYDFTETTGDVGLTFDLSERSRVLISAYYRLNDFSESNQEFDGKGAKVGFNFNVSERTIVHIDAGADSTEDEAGTSYTNPIGAVSLIHDMGTTRVIAAYQRTVGGSGTSDLSVRDNVNVLATRTLSERLEIGAGLYAYQMESVQGEPATISDQNYFQARAMLTWNLTQVLSLDVDYHYTFIDRQVTESDANSNRVNLWIRYHPVF
jgi:hypothetical protein